MVQYNLQRTTLAAVWLLVGLTILHNFTGRSGREGNLSKAASAPSFKIKVIADGKTSVITTQAQSLGEALYDSNFKIDEDDKVVPTLKTPLTSGMTVRIIRMLTKSVTTTELIPRQTIRRPSSSLKRGASRVAIEGRDGKRESTYSVTLADGRWVMKQLMSSKVVADPANRVIVYGMGTTTPSRGFFSSRVYTMSATAYDPKNCGGSGSGRTASGMKGGKGVVAVDPRVIRLGTKLYIEGYGFAVAGDTGGAIKGRRIDLGHNSSRAARQFGRKKVVVHVLD